jgi:arylsulfatase A-like enzyme
MIHRAFPLFIVGILMLSVQGCAVTDDDARSERTDRPNIIYIYTDDLGYGEVGAYGQEKIETPHLDALAESGILFTQHYTGTPVCAPARYNLLTGIHSGNAYIRGNSELGGRGDVWSYEAMFENPELEGQRPIPASTVTMGDVLKEAGYRTGAIGKWGNGGPGTEGHPNRQGFDFFYGYLCQRQAHTYFPTHLWRNEERHILDNELVPPHQALPADLDPRDRASYARFHDQPDFSPDLMHLEALRFIEENRENPFFLYLPTPIPHVSLQAPEQWVNYYVEKFGDEEPYVGRERGGGYVPVRYPRATYAAMVTYLDAQIGEIVDKLKELGLYDNTVIMFSSDNGPITSFYGGEDFFDSGGPFNIDGGRGKGSVHEGGIRVPMIASWPNRIPAGTTTDHPSAQFDVLPTLAEIIGVSPPPGIDGISFLPTLLGNEGDQVKHPYLFWEYPERGGQQAVLLGSWKGIRKDIRSEGNLVIELYNLDDDIEELNNVAAQYPDIVRQIETIMETSRVEPELNEFKMPALGDRPASARS